MPQFLSVFVTSFLILFSCSVYAKTYRIGVLVPLTGSKADKGIPLKNAVELFAEQFNASAAAAGNKLEVIVLVELDIGYARRHGLDGSVFTPIFAATFTAVVAPIVVTVILTICIPSSAVDPVVCASEPTHAEF